MCMQPPAHIKHVLLYGLNWHSAKQLTYNVLVSIQGRKHLCGEGEEAGQRRRRMEEEEEEEEAEDEEEEEEETEAEEEEEEE